MKKKSLLGVIIIAALLTGCTSQIKDASPNPPVSHSGTVAAEPLHSRTVPETHTMPESNQISSVITEEEARQIALDKVPGAVANDVVKFETDYDDGRLVYEGKIHYGNKEYEFEIDGATGKTLEWDAEPLHDR